MNKLFMMLAFAGALAALSACGPDDSAIEPEDETSTTTDAVRSDGSICHGVCWGGGPTYLCYPNITVRCHEQIVAACHRRGLSFVDAYWSHWGCG